MRSDQIRTYSRKESVVFLKTDGPFGGLSNMAGGFPLHVNGTRILTVEALYQACRFPHLPEVQSLIIEQRSPMTAKMKSKPYRREARPDWDHVRVKIMRWCLRVKLVQNWRAFARLLLETGERPIVEESRRDDFWGAKPVDEPTLLGMNVLGRLLMELREAAKAESRESFLQVEPIAIPDFLLGGLPIGTVTIENVEAVSTVSLPTAYPSRDNVRTQEFSQPSFFDAPMLKEAAPPAYLSDIPKVVHIADLKPYAQYKDSGLPWLGQVPGHWNLLRAKCLFREIDERSKTGKEELLSVSHLTGVTPRRHKTITMFLAKSNVGHKVCRPGDTVINTMWAWMGALGVTQHTGIVSPAYGVYRPIEGCGITPRYADHLLRTPTYSAEYQRRSTGVNSSRMRLYPEQFLRMPVIVPTVDEQAAIVRFLDWANGRLERTIRAKRKVIALLNEQKQAISHRAITRGLDPNVPLKASSVAWLGDIPQHWEIRRLKTVLARNDGGVWGSNFDVSGMIVLRSTEQAVDGSWRINNPAVIRLTDTQIRSALLKTGDIVVTKSSGSQNHIGKASLVTTEVAEMQCCYSNFMQRLRTTTDIASEYLTLFLNCKTGRMHYQYSSTSTTGLGNLTRDTIATLPMPVPSRAEQALILGGLRTQLNPIEITISRLHSEIELLREYRTRLVADVVTGKLDVREAAARLPTIDAESPIEPDSADAEEASDELIGAEA